jgi:site-specific recombinase XerD
MEALLMKPTSDKSALSVVTKHGGADVVSIGAAPSTCRSAAIKYYLEASLSPNTVRAYKSDLRMFLSWGGAIPSSPEELASYLAEQASWLSPYTLTRRLSAIRRAHRSLGLSDPSDHAMVRGVVKGIWRQHGKAQRQARPLLLHDLHQLLPAMLGRKGVRDRALTLIGFRAALRRSELCSIDVEDIAVSDEGVLLHVRHSKTDQQSKGRIIAVPFAKSGPCAVRALLAWLVESNVESGAVFQSIDRWGSLNGRLSGQSISIIVRDYALAVGIDTCGLSAHSLRAGFVTSAAKAGLQVHAIQQQTGHRSLEMLYRYVRTGNPFSDNANDGLA